MSSTMHPPWIVKYKQMPIDSMSYRIHDQPEKICLKNADFAQKTPEKDIMTILHMVIRLHLNDAINL